MGGTGGDWFHGACINVSQEECKKDWICSKCKITPENKLKEDLEIENLKIDAINPDGNCLFSALASCLNEISEVKNYDHVNLRKILMQEFLRLFYKYKGQWNQMHFEDTNIETKFVQVIAKSGKELIDKNINYNEYFVYFGRISSFWHILLKVIDLFF